MPVNSRQFRERRPALQCAFDAIAAALLFFTLPCISGASELVAKGDVLDEVAQTWRINEVYTLEVDGTFYEARYAGWKVIDGEGMYYFENGRIVQPGEGPPAESTGPNESSSGTSSAASAAAGAAGVTTLYRILVVPPSVERQLKQAKRELGDAQAARVEAEHAFRIRIEEANAKAESWSRDLAERLSRPMPPPIIFTSAPSLEPSGAEQFHTPNAADRAELSSISATISNARVFSGFNAEVKEIGSAALNAADEASIAGDRVGFGAAITVARTMADVLVGLDPFTGLARDTLEYFTGVNQITGEALTSNERTLRLVGMAAGVVSFGVASSFLRVTEKIVAIAKRFRRVTPPPSLLLENASRLIRTDRGAFELTNHAVWRVGSRELTNAQIRATINRGERYWDRLHNNASFVAREGFIRGSSLQVAVDLPAKKVVTVIAKDFNPNTLLKDGRPRWVVFPEK
jgi:hypothetical protein